MRDRPASTSASEVFLLFSAVIAASACDEAEPDDYSQSTDLRSSDSDVKSHPEPIQGDSDADRLGDGRGQSEDVEARPLLRNESQVASPCGDARVALLTSTHHEYHFCTFGSGADSFEGVLEVMPIGEPSRLGAFECGSDVYAALVSAGEVEAESSAVPSALVDSCTRGGVEERRAPSALLADISPQFVGVYCTGAGQTNFGNGPCHQLWSDYGYPTFSEPNGSYVECNDAYNPPNTWQCNGFNVDSAPWHSTGYCRSGSYLSHTRTATSQLGAPAGDLTPGGATASARELVASCNGVTQFQSYYKASGGNSWISTLDFTIPSDITAVWTYTNTTAKDIQYVAASETGAYHRYNGGFVTSAW